MSCSTFWPTAAPDSWGPQCNLELNTHLKKSKLKSRAALNSTNLSSVLCPLSSLILRPRGSPAGPRSTTGSVLTASCLRPCASCGSDSWSHQVGNLSTCCHCRPAPADHLINDRRRENLSLVKSHSLSLRLFKGWAMDGVSYKSCGVWTGSSYIPVPIKTLNCLFRYQIKLPIKNKEKSSSLQWFWFICAYLQVY